ncbi:MAG: gamma-glutamylcyclotransferase [Hyphomicrobiales bacterium]|nr:gamma-glutamylcyclotransferase [Hyphomicrobiales bacterium]
MKMQTRQMMQVDYSDIDELWVFGYGSLMWRPGFDYVEKAPAKCVGFQRKFCIYSTVYRGTPEDAGLVLGLDVGGETIGMAFKVAPENKTLVMDYLREREQINDVYREILHPLDIVGHGIKMGIFYVAIDGHEQYAGDLSPDQQAEIIARSAGGMGSNKDYLFNSHDILLELNIHDEYMAGLVNRVKAKLTD